METSWLASGSFHRRREEHKQPARRMDCTYGMCHASRSRALLACRPVASEESAAAAPRRARAAPSHLRIVVSAFQACCNAAQQHHTAGANEVISPSRSMQREGGRCTPLTSTACDSQARLELQATHLNVWSVLQVGAPSEKCDMTLGAATSSVLCVSL